MANCLFSSQLLWCNQQDTHRSLSKAEYFPLHSFNIELLCVIPPKFILVQCYPHWIWVDSIDIVYVLPLQVPLFSQAYSKFLFPLTNISSFLFPALLANVAFYLRCGEHTLTSYGRACKTKWGNISSGTDWKKHLVLFEWAGWKQSILRGAFCN